MVGGSRRDFKAVLRTAGKKDVALWKVWEVEGFGAFAFPLATALALTIALTLNLHLHPPLPVLFTLH